MRQAGIVPTYRETLRLPASWWLAGAFFALSVGWIFLVVGGERAGTVTGVIAAIPIAAALWHFGSLTVEVTNDDLVIGNAVLEGRFRGLATSLDAKEFRHTMGVGADARAFIKIRPYIKTGALIPVTDPSDPTPYWIISSRHPEHLVAALNASAQNQSIGENTDVP